MSQSTNTRAIPENRYKVYVDVDAHFTKNGDMLPVRVTWEDSTVYEIDKIIDVCRAASLKAGGIGMRYTCMICGIQTFLFWDDHEQRWFVERRET